MGRKSAPGVVGPGAKAGLGQARRGDSSWTGQKRQVPKRLTKKGELTRINPGAWVSLFWFWGASKRRVFNNFKEEEK
jgi:hypothetical protein